MIVNNLGFDAVGDSTKVHFQNWLSAIAENKQDLCNNPPDLGAAAICIVNMGSDSYRKGKAYFFDAQAQKVTDADESWAKQWEDLSHKRGKPRHVPGWKAGDTGSVLEEPEYMKLAGKPECIDELVPEPEAGPDTCRPLGDRGLMRNKVDGLLSRAPRLTHVLVSQTASLIEDHDPRWMSGARRPGDLDSGVRQSSLEEGDRGRDAATRN